MFKHTGNVSFAAIETAKSGMPYARLGLICNRKAADGTEFADSYVITFFLPDGISWVDELRKGDLIEVSGDDRPGRTFDVDGKKYRETDYIGSSGRTISAKADREARRAEMAAQALADEAAAKKAATAGKRTVKKSKAA